MNPPYHAPVRAPINLAVPGQSSTIEIADRNRNIITGKLSRSLKKLNPVKPWAPKDFFLGTDYYTHPIKSYLPKPESEIIPSRPPSAELSAEDQPFYVAQRS